MLGERERYAAANALTGSFMVELTLDQLPPAARPPPRSKVNKPLSRPRQQLAANAFNVYRT